MWHQVPFWCGIRCKTFLEEYGCGCVWAVPGTLSREIYIYDTLPACWERGFSGVQPEIGEKMEENMGFGLPQKIGKNQPKNRKMPPKPYF